MHPIPFFLKRAHHSSLAKQRKWLAEFEITPARYDLLVVIADINRWMKKVHFVHQSDLWKALGYTGGRLQDAACAREIEACTARAIARLRSTTGQRRAHSKGP